MSKIVVALAHLTVLTHLALLTLLVHLTHEAQENLIQTQHNLRELFLLVIKLFDLFGESGKLELRFTHENVMLFFLLFEFFALVGQALFALSDFGFFREKLFIFLFKFSFTLGDDRIALFDLGAGLGDFLVSFVECNHGSLRGCLGFCESEFRGFEFLCVDFS